MKTANRFIHTGLLTILGRPKPALILVAAAVLLLLAAAQPAMAAESIDYDTDDDGLIEIHNLAQLHNIRWDINGDGRIDRQGLRSVQSFQKEFWGLPTRDEAYPNAAEGMGCPAKGCRGYELEADLDFDSNGDGLVTADDHNGVYWKDGDGWHNGFLIGGTVGAPWSAEFNGNGHTISNLFINQPLHVEDPVGLFGVVTGTIRNLGVINADIGVIHGTGGIIAAVLYRGGSVQNSYTTGKIHQLPQPAYLQNYPVQYYPPFLGGLVGSMEEDTEITASYSTASVTGRHDTVIGGLAGVIARDGTITASYATGTVTGADGHYTGGLVGQIGGWGMPWQFGRHSWNRVGAIEGGKITGSYATGKVAGSPGISGGLAGKATDAIGQITGSPDGVGLVGKAVDPIIADSYYREGAAGQLEAGVGAAKSTKELQEPTGYTGIYAKWNRDLDGDKNPDDPWDFGTSSQYPVLKVDFNGDGKATWEEFGKQRASQGATPNSQSPEEQAAAAHPEVYHEAEYGLKVACSEVQKFHAKLTFDLGGYTGKLALSLSLWGSSSYLSYAAHGLATPALHHDGQTASVEISTHPPQTRFRLDTPDGRNLLLGYADCRTDAPVLDEDGNPPPPPPKTPEERAAEDNKEVYEADNGNGDDAPMSVSCEVGDDSATLTFNLGGHSGAVQLTLMQWDGVVFRSYAALGLTAPALQRNGQTATVEIPTHTPERVRFRLDSQYGRNLLLGYADCHEDTPGPVTEVTEETPEETVTPVEPVSPPPVQSAAATLPPAATAANREVYADAGRAMLVSCTGVTSKGATLIFDLGSYTRSLTMVLSLWDGTVFRSYASQNIPQPALERDGQKATVSISTNPALTRFRLDSDLGTNLLLGYADCRTDPS